MAFDIFEGLESLGFSSRPKQDDLYMGEEKKKAEKAADVFKPTDFLYMRSLECPVCDHKFENAAVKHTRLRYVASTSDLRPMYEPVDPVYYDVGLCPKCGYASMIKTFTKCSEKQADLIRTVVMPQYNGHEYPLLYNVDHAIERYKMALLCAVTKKAKDSEKGLLCLRMAWLMRDKGEKDAELSCMEQALKGLMAAYEREPLPICGMDGETFEYLVGELLRVVGRYDESLKWLGQVVISKHAHQRLKDKALIARDLIIETRKR